MFFQEISYHLAANPARFSLEQRPLNQQQLDLYKMLRHRRKMEARNFPRAKQVCCFLNINIWFFPNKIFKALRAVLLTASDGETFSTRPAIIGKEFVLSTRVAEELFYSSVVGKYEQIHIFVSYSKVFFLHIFKGPWQQSATTGTRDFFRQSLQTERASWVLQPYKISHLFHNFWSSGSLSNELPLCNLRPLLARTEPPW